MESMLINYALAVSKKEELSNLINRYNQQVGSASSTNRRKIESVILTYIRNVQLTNDFAQFVTASGNFIGIRDELYDLLPDFMKPVKPDTEARPFGIVFGLLLMEVAESIKDEKQKYFFLASIHTIGTSSILDRKPYFNFLSLSDTAFAHSYDFAAGMYITGRGMQYEEEFKQLQNNK